MGEPVTFQFEGYLSRIEIHSFLSNEQVRDAERQYGGKVALSHYTVPDLDTLRAAGYVPASEMDALRAEVEALRKGPGVEDGAIAITLNEYQRENLLWLLNALGYPWNETGGGVEPFNLANSGDWVGEIALMIADPHGQPYLLAQKSNDSIQGLRNDVASWLRAKIQKA